MLRALAIGLSVALAVVLLKGPQRARVASLPLLACLVAYLLRAAPELAQAPAAVLRVLSMGASGFPVAFWWLVRQAFEDRADMPVPAWLGAAGLALIALGSPWPFSGPGAQVLQKLVAAAFVLVALWQVWATRGGDLVASRRRMRGWLLGYVGLHGLAVLGVELHLQGTTPPAWLDGLNVAVISVGLLVGVACLAGFEPRAAQALFGAPSPVPMPPADVPAAPDGAPAADGAAEAQVLQRLQQLMVIDGLYRDADLSLGSLARRLGLPEYRLRELIHRQLGYRNFAAFVNEHRLHDVEQRLADPAWDRRPILTLALEAGFGSVGPFNRSFKARHGMTPSAYRERLRTAGRVG